ncbi:MAG: hypothetical protein ABI333_03455, partial [bacterium]
MRKVAKRVWVVAAISGLLLTAGCRDKSILDFGIPDSGPPDAGCQAATDCNDGNDCTQDLCTNGVCENPGLADGAACDGGDGDLCNSTCQAGTCTTNTPVACADDGEACNGAEACNPTTGLCESSGNLANDTPCDGGDSDFCNSTCQAGACTTATPVSCPDDGNPCNGAEACAPATGQCGSAGNLADGTACGGGGDLCTATCQAGVCGGPAVACADDGDLCNGAEACVPTTGLCAAPGNQPDGTACGGAGDLCTATCQAGVCGGPAVLCADDGNLCNGAEACVPATGLCASPGPVADGTACGGGADLCTGTCQAGLCTGPAVICPDDGNLCNGAEACVPATGLCVSPGPIADGTACGGGGDLCTATCNAGVCGGPPVACVSDGNLCNGTEACVPATGLCASPGPIADGTACGGGGDLCTATCTAGLCAGAAVVCADDGESCNGAEACVPGTGLCASAGNLPAGTACNDGVFCNGADTCDGAGVCAVHPGDPCAAGNACNNTCNEATDTCFSPAATACDDGLFCNGVDTCDGAGTCNSAGDPCPPGTCDELADNCAACGDGIVGPGEQCDPAAPASNNCCNPVTCQWTGAGVADPQAVCAGAAECQLNVCNGAGGCAINNVADGTACTNNGLFCDGAETCQAGACTSAGDPCAGGSVCNNTCNEATDTCFSPAATPCDDGAFCNGADTCNGAGACVSAGDPCAGGPACNNTCNEATDTCFSPAATSCDDGAFCNGADTCNGAGACVSAG